MNCPKCRAENDKTACFCEECGASLETACSNFGQPLTPGKKFCRFCGTRATPATIFGSTSPERYTPKHLAERILRSKADLEGERKHVTVLFADLKDSMELLANRDPEDARKLLDPVLERMMEAVHHYEGTVNQVMGDGIMALFGAPLAHEDHAVRACYAALRMQESVAQYAEGVFRSQGVPIQIRVGLNSGEVVVRAIGSDLRMDYTAVGHPVVMDGVGRIADTTRPIVQYGSGFAPRWHVPRQDIDESALIPVEGQPFCPYKSLSSYCDIGERKRVAWSYMRAWPEVAVVSRFVSFEPDKIEVFLNDRKLVLEAWQGVKDHGIDRSLDPDEMLKQGSTTAHP